MGGTSVLLLEIFDELLYAFPDFIQEAPAINKKNLCVGSKKATFGY